MIFESEYHFEEVGSPIGVWVRARVDIEVTDDRCVVGTIKALGIVAQNADWEAVEVTREMFERYELRVARALQTPDGLADLRRRFEDEMRAARDLAGEDMAERGTR